MNARTNVGYNTSQDLLKCIFLFACLMKTTSNTAKAAKAVLINIPLFFPPSREGHRSCRTDAAVVRNAGLNSSTSHCRR